MAMRWESLAFLHWSYSAETIQERLPDGLRVDTFGGQALIGIVPFVMAGVRPRGLFPVPGVSRFPELNVRTYVTDGTKPGVWFFSLDAHSRLAVRAARIGFHLPYFDARMSTSTEGTGRVYRSQRTHRGEPPAGFRATYARDGEWFRSAAGTLEHWLTERYCLYAADGRGRILRGEVHHAPWTLAPGRVRIEEESLVTGDGLPPVEGAPLVHVAGDLEVVAWPPRRVAG